MRQRDEVCGRYRLEDLQGHGPMSQVWRAHDGTLDRTVALKILAPTADLDRFRREARALAALAHENVMRVYDYGESEVGPFMALEWLPGGTLEERLAPGPLQPEETYRVARGVAAGLAHLHARGLVHRDLKPANVLFDEEGRPKLADFGLVREGAGSDTLTEAGTVLGTAAYISPEQAAGEPAGPASDVYSFGVILFRALTGALPFVANDALALADLHRHAPPPAVETLQPSAPPLLAAVTAAALRKDPAQRPSDGEALLAALGASPAAFAAPDTEQTQVLPAAVAATRRVGRRSAAFAFVLALLATAGGVLAWAVAGPPGTAPAGTGTTGSVAGTQKISGANSTQAASLGTAGAGGGRQHTKRRRHKPGTTGRTTTGTGTTSSTMVPLTTAPITTFPATTAPTTVPTTTAPTTTAPATTAPTTTQATTTAPTTTASTTTSTTTTGAGTTTAATTTGTT